ncbi:MAG: MoaD/ThiS family protein [Verrucomicrobia bacterium]|nr:MoaD/ThiS family protein [Verrucomicrobiota bacterium]
MRILFFGQLKTITGNPEIVLSFAAGGADELWRELIALHPGLAPMRPQVRLAQNGEFAASTARFNDTDEIALIPPVSGG